MGKFGRHIQHCIDSAATTNEDKPYIVPYQSHSSQIRSGDFTHTSFLSLWNELHSFASSSYTQSFRSIWTDIVNDIYHHDDNNDDDDDRIDEKVASHPSNALAIFVQRHGEERSNESFCGGCDWCTSTQRSISILSVS